MPMLEWKWTVIGVVFLIALLALAAVFQFGRLLYRGVAPFEWWLDLFGRRLTGRPSSKWMAVVTDGFKSFLEKRNDFFSIYSQFAIATLIVTFLVVLLIMEVIEPDAGLPLIAAVVAYVLGRTATSSPASNAPDTEPDTPEKPQPAEEPAEKRG